MSDRGRRNDDLLIALQYSAKILAIFCGITAIGSLAVCLFTLPDAWFMVIIWAVLACALEVFSRWDF